MSGKATAVFVLLISTFITQSFTGHVLVSVLTDAPINKVSDKFVSFALESSLIQKNWETFNTRSEKLLTLTRGLSPFYLRFGGTSADFLTFVNDTGSCKYGPIRKEAFKKDWIQDEMDWLQDNHKNYTNYTMSACDFDKLNEYVTLTGGRLLFDLNVLLRRADASWDSSNARKIIEYAIQKGYNSHLDWELGNEPDSFHHAINRSLSATRLAKDFLSLYDLIHEEPYREYYINSILVGPDTTKPNKRADQYLKQYLEIVKNRLNAVTWHQYYIDGRTATVDDFTDPAVLDLYPDQVTQIQAVLAELRLGGLDEWMGETGSAWGGGAPGLSDRYLAGFLYLDKLGVAARHGLKVVIRQSWYGGHYAMIDHNLEPNPDYWAALVYKTVVGNLVLDVKNNQTASHHGLRIYTYCANSKRYVRGSVVLMILNLKTVDETLEFTNTELRGSVVDEYQMAPPGGVLTASSVMLNHKKLYMPTERMLPTLVPTVLPAGSHIHVPARTFGFWVFKNTKVKACVQ